MIHHYVESENIDRSCYGKRFNLRCYELPESIGEFVDELLIEDRDLLPKISYPNELFGTKSIIEAWCGCASTILIVSVDNAVVCTPRLQALIKRFQKRIVETSDNFTHYVLATHEYPVN